MASFRCGRMSEFREPRQSIGLSQQECAARLDVSVETFCAWDSGRRLVGRAAYLLGLAVGLRLTRAVDRPLGGAR